MAPIMNILTNELQWACEKNKSARDIIPYVKYKILSSKLNGRILFDLAKPLAQLTVANFGGILYIKGLPNNLINMVKISHQNNTLKENMKKNK